MLSAHGRPVKKQTEIEKNRLLKGSLNTRIWSGIKELCETLRIPYHFDIRVVPADYRFQHVQYKAGQYIHRNGQNFESLYVVNSGFLKTVHLDDLLNDQILSFPMKGDVLGVDGIHTGRYASDVITLSTCDIIVLPYKTLQAAFKECSNFDHLLLTILSCDLGRKQSHLCLIGSASSEARVAQFLVRLGQRYGELGYSSNVFELRMARHEIGSYLGLTLETVSRTLTMFHDHGLITVARRCITINSQQALATLRKLYPIELKKHQSIPTEISGIPTTLSVSNSFRPAQFLS